METCFRLRRRGKELRAAAEFAAQPCARNCDDDEREGIPVGPEAGPAVPRNHGASSALLSNHRNGVIFCIRTPSGLRFRVMGRRAVTFGFPPACAGAAPVL